MIETPSTQTPRNPFNFGRQSECLCVCLPSDNTTLLRMTGLKGVHLYKGKGHF